MGGGSTDVQAITQKTQINMRVFWKDLQVGWVEVSPRHRIVGWRQILLLFHISLDASQSRKPLLKQDCLIKKYWDTLKLITGFFWALSRITKVLGIHNHPPIDLETFPNIIYQLPDDLHVIQVHPLEHPH